MEFSEDTAIVEMEVPARWVGKTLLELDVRKKNEHQRHYRPQKERA